MMNFVLERDGPLKQICISFRKVNKQHRQLNMSTWMQGQVRVSVNMNNLQTITSALWANFMKLDYGILWI